MEKKRVGTTKIYIVGGAIVAIIMILGTFLTGRMATKDTEEAVENVSLLYLTELAGRREQVVESKINDYIKDLDIALGIMDSNDLESVESLQAYQYKMKQLYNLEKFAFVNSRGVIYTSRGTRNDINDYGFDYNTLEGPIVLVKNADNNNKKVVIATSIDNIPFDGDYLVACFMEMDMQTLLDSVSLQSDSSNTTFCNLYTRTGTPLSNKVLGGLASEDNLIKALESATFDDKEAYNNFIDDFTNGKEGVITFTYNDVKETLYYIPVGHTDWMLTYLIRESVIIDQIETISSGIIIRSLILSVVIGVVLIVLFIIVFKQNKKADMVDMERKVEEAENRVKQEELEEQLAMQEELLAQEKMRVEQDSMITALSSDYTSVYYVDIDTDSAVCYRQEGHFNENIEAGQQFQYTLTIRQYAYEYVTDEYRDEFLAFVQPDNIRKMLNKEKIISCRYLVRRGDVESYEMIRMAGVRRPQDRDDNMVHAIGMGFSDIDLEMRKSMEQSSALSDALAAAEEANKAKTVFLSNMSHEIRTPMNAIIGLDSLALHEPNLSDKTKEYLEKIGSSAEHLLSLINDILDMSRIESGRMTIQNGEFAFSKMLEQVNTIFSGQCQEKGLTYNCHINGEIDDYYIGDDMKLRQVLINILGNAVKFTPTGGEVDLIVEKTAGFDKKSAIKFIIRDTGIGMSEEYIPKIFDTFTQEDEKAKNKYGSSGLGMAITKRIVEMMNGTINVESKKGVGTTFTVAVTLMDSDRKYTDEDDSMEIHPQDMSVLVVDDDPIACDHAKLVLEKIGINAEVAASGSEAVEMVKLHHARREPYNLIIMDWQMPKMDGIEATKQIRSEIGDESAVIVLTAYNWDDIFDDAKGAGVDSFISKPLFTGELLEEFKKAIKKKNTAYDTEENKVDLNGRRILLAEDMEINAEIMINLLEMRDMVTEHAENGKACVEMFENSDEGYYDAILMDMRMPEMDGLEAAKAIRSIEGRSDAKSIPIIALTANAFDEDVQRSLQAGLDAHLSKPVDPDILFETLETMIKD